jgi:ribose 5-phosphate isomerase B
MPSKKIYLASDHAGFELKEALLPFLGERGFMPEDLGPFTLDPQDDYPDTVVPLARRVAAEPGSFGIVIGGSGQGEAIACNRFKGVRAAVYYGGKADILKLSREHNDANVLSLGARFMTAEEAKEAALAWLLTNFSGDERHARRIQKLDNVG